MSQKEGGFQTEPELANHWYLQIFAGIQAMARDMGYEVRKDIVSDPVRVLLSSYVPPQPSEASGVIVCGIHDEQYVGMFGSQRVPLVTVDYWTQDLAADCVTVDIESEAYQITDLLARRGHSSLGFMGLGRRAWSGPFHEYDPDIYRIVDCLRRVAPRGRRVTPFSAAGPSPIYARLRRTAPATSAPPSRAIVVGSGASVYEIVLRL